MKERLEEPLPSRRCKPSAAIFRCMYIRIFYVVQLIKHSNYTLTRMTTFIKTKFKKSDDQTNINKYRVPENITESYHIKFSLPNNHYSKIH